MELYTLKINVNKQRLSFGENKPEIFSGDQSIDFVEFTFEDAMWNFPDIWAIFSRQKGTSYQVALEDNKVMIPAEVMQKRGYVYIGLMATDGENVQTSNVLQYSIGQGSTNVDAITPSASIYEQFLADLDAYQTAVADLDDIESRITTAEGNVSMIEQAVTDLNEQLDDIDVDISTINGQITTIQNNIGTAQGDIVSIQNWINALNGQVAGLDTAVGTLSNRVTALQSSVTSLEGRLTTAGNTLTDFEGRLTTAGTTLTNLEDSISDAENDIQTVQGDIETIQSDIEDIQTAIEQNNVVTDVTAEGISLVDNHIADLSFMCVTDTASGEIATFSDGSGLAMKKAEVSLEPIQDLHGYDKPWAGGGGVNKLPALTPQTVTNVGLTCVVDEDGWITLNGTSTSSGNLILEVNGSGLFEIPSGMYMHLFNDFTNSNIAFVLNYTDSTNNSPSPSSQNRIFDISGSAGKTVRQIRFYFQSGVTLTNAKLRPMLAASSTAIDWQPYSNICPIDGYEDVGVSVRGVNMWDEDWEEGGIRTADGTTVASQSVRSKNFNGCLPSTTYYIRTAGGNSSNVFIFFYDADKNYISYETRNNATVIMPSTAHYFKIQIISAYGTVYHNDISINYPSTDHDYHAYAGTDYTTDLATNIWDEEWVNAYHNTSGEQVADNRFISCKNKIRVFPNTTYYFKSPNVDFELFEYDSSGDFVTKATSYLKNATFTTGDNTYYIEFSTRVANALTTYNNDIRIYYAPMPDGKVYGGTVDLVSGRLVVDRAMVDLGSLTWTKQGNSPNYYFASTLTGRKQTASTTERANFVCSKYIEQPQISWYNSKPCIFSLQNSNVFAISDEAYNDDDATAFKTAMNGVQLVYELATPQTYQLTPQQIQTLVGTNNVWSEDGTIEVEYIANLKDYIDKKINA